MPVQDDKVFQEDAFNSINEMIKWSFLNKSYDGKYTPVFHYCSIEVMKSILQSKKLWFTDAKYLNDLQEFTYIQNVYRQVCLKQGDKIDKDFFDVIYNDELFSKIEGYKKEYLISSAGNPIIHFEKELCRVFVCCFSFESDELMMWNYYGGNNAACNIEFSLMFPSMSSFDGIELRKSSVLYGEESYNAVKEILNQVYTIWKKAQGKICNIDIQEFLVSQLNGLRLFLKNGAFKNEKEYRLVLLVPENKIDEIGLKFFVRGNMLIPYIEINLDDINAEIKGIKLGPYAGNELNKYSVKELLKINGLNEISVTASKVPIRNYNV